MIDMAQRDISLDFGFSWKKLLTLQGKEG